MTRSFLATVLMALLLAAPLPSLADDARQLAWEELVPESEPLVDPLADLEINLRYDLGYIALVQAEARRGLIATDSPEYQNAQTLLEELSAENDGIDALLQAVVELDAEIERRNNSLVDDLDGQVVRIPGYALPLEFAEGGITEFLLVPYVGACIHVPPPPPNQMLFVELEQEFVVQGLFQPVWVTGRLELAPSTQRLEFVDGVSNVAAGYALADVTVEPYQ